MNTRSASGKTTALEPVQSQTVAAIEAAYVQEHSEERRGYLGASVLGDPCERKLWYGFRWASPPEAFDGRMLRLFQTGHREEARLVEDLRRIGCDVLEGDPETGRQWAFAWADGHARGHLDGIVERLPEAPKTAHVLECKTHNDKSFKALVKSGVAEAKPVHWAQMQLGMWGRGLSRALYLAVNKNDDSLYSERVTYEPAAAAALAAKAERIVAAHHAPAKLHDDPTAKMAFACSFCPARGVCHDGQWAPRHCRTCLHATAVDSGGWSCARHNRALSLDDQRAGCAHHTYLPSLVPGEQVDADEALEWVEYQMPDGATWRDGPGASPPEGAP